MNTNFPKRWHPIFSIVLAILSFPAQVLGFGSGLNVCTPPVRPVTISNPTVVTAFTQAALQAALDDGGQITFATENPVTIPIDSELQLHPDRDTVLDGKGLVTLDGRGHARMFRKGWHDPAHAVSITFQNIRMINGKAPAGAGTGDHSGGAINVGHPGTRLYVIDSTFEDNATTDIHVADNQGGAIFVANIHETVISGSEFRRNRAGNGGALGGIATGLFLFNSRFTGNGAVDDSAGGVVRGHGGAVHLDGVTNDYNPDSNKRVHVCGCKFENNTSVRGGGALKVTVSDGNDTKATYERSEFVGNVASGASGVEGGGGAIYHIEDDHAGGSGELNVEILACVFDGNQAWRSGGGVALSVLGKIDVINSTFLENRATDLSLGMGGGLALGLGEAAVTNCTFARNYAWFHGGAIQAGTVTLKNDLFYYNESEREWACYQMTEGVYGDGGGNLQFPRTRFNQAGSPDDCRVTPTVVIADPLLGNLANNGGPTRTMSLGKGSPAIDAGSNVGAPDTDQRGHARDAARDIGAYEFDHHVSVDLRDVILVLRLCAGMSVDMSDMRVSDIDADGRIGLPEAVYAMRWVSEAWP